MWVDELTLNLEICTYGVRLVFFSCGSDKFEKIYCNIDDPVLKSEDLLMHTARENENVDCTRNRFVLIDHENNDRCCRYYDARYAL